MNGRVYLIFCNYDSKRLDTFADSLGELSHTTDDLRNAVGRKVVWNSWDDIRVRHPQAVQRDNPEIWRAIHDDDVVVVDAIFDRAPQQLGWIDE